MSRRSTRFLALSFAATLGVVAIESRAIEITHDGSTIVFRDDFESGTPGAGWDNGAQPGDWPLSGIRSLPKPARRYRSTPKRFPAPIRWTGKPLLHSNSTMDIKVFRAAIFSADTHRGN